MGNKAAFHEKVLFYEPYDYYAMIEAISRIFRYLYFTFDDTNKLRKGKFCTEEPIV